MTVNIESFGKVDAQDVNLYTFTNSSGYSINLTNYGGIVQSIIVPDIEGNLADVALGFDRLDGYFVNNPFLGCIVGRFANRIRNGKFNLNDKEYQLNQNADKHHIHGGKEGFNKKVFDASIQHTGGLEKLVLNYFSLDGEENYPGNLRVRAEYSWSDDCELKIEMSATTDKDTIINLTNHSYFNLSGDMSKQITDHEAQIFANQFNQLDEDCIPVGTFDSVEGTPLDLREPKRIGDQIDAEHPQMVYGLGYDVNYILNNPDGELKLAAKVTHPESGRILETYTTAPCVQFYTGNNLDGTDIGKNGLEYQKRTGFCLEPQTNPDSPNRPEFPSPVLKPGETYQNTIVYKFLTTAV